MTKKIQDAPADAAELRRRAEQRLAARRAAALPGSPLSELEARRLVHELQVHQLELELQNEELTRARAEAEEALARYAELYEHAPIGYLSLDRQGVIRRINLTGARLLGVERARLVGARLGLLVDAVCRPALHACLAEVLARPGLSACELVFPREGQAPLSVQLTASAAEGGHECRVVLLDVTAQRELEEQRRTALKMEAIGRLAGGVAHDFNNLLAVILNYAQFGLEDLREDGAVREDLLEVKKAGERAAALTRQLLAFSSRQALRPQALDLGRILGALEKTLRRLVGEDIELVCSPAPDLGLLVADPGQLEQVILNLALNARDAMPGGGRLTLAARNVSLDAGPAARLALAPGAYVALTVADSGCGMDEPTRARMFEPFFTTKERGRGTGLGLSTVYGVVKQSGGAIQVTSQPGQGAAFEIYLPRAPGDAARAAAADRAAAPAVGGSETVLVVEDEETLLKVATRILSAAGYRVLAAAGGAEALQLVERDPGTIQLLLTDVVMPGMSGRVLAERLASIRPGIKVLYMSGYDDDALVHHGVLEEGVQLLGKPFSPAELARKVREVLDAGGAPDPEKLPSPGAAR
jgi:two-component system, cell cycle sensor histidine kinase and response regulator CckA